MTPEGKIKAQVKAYLKTVPDCWFYMPVQNGMGVVGIPDIVGVCRGRFFAIETKAPGKEKNVTANQSARMREIRAAGGRCIVTCDVETVREFLP